MQSFSEKMQLLLGEQLPCLIGRYILKRQIEVILKRVWAVKVHLCIRLLAGYHRLDMLHLIIGAISINRVDNNNENTNEKTNHRILEN